MTRHNNGTHCWPVNGCHCWLVQQWAPGTRFALLSKPAVAPHMTDAANCQLRRCTQRLDNHRSGAVLVAALVCLLIVTAMLATMLQGTLRARRQLHAQRDLRQTELLLQAGADRAAAQLLRDADYRGETWRPPAAAFAGRDEAQVTVEAFRESDEASWEVHIVAEYPLGTDASIRRSRVFHISSPPSQVQE